MRFRFVLPVVSVALGIFLFHWGDVQVRRIVLAAGGAHEGVPIEFAMARYPHYALNAPAWAILLENRGMRWSPSTYWTGRDLRYFSAVIVLWYLIGFRIDQKVRKTGTRAIRPTKWRRRILSLACILWGLFVCHSILPDFVPLKAYGLWLPNRHAYWFVAAVLGWGLGLVTVSAYLLFRREEPAARLATTSPKPRSLE